MEAHELIDEINKALRVRQHHMETEWKDCQVHVLNDVDGSGETIDGAFLSEDDGNIYIVRK